MSSCSPVHFSANPSTRIIDAREAIEKEDSFEKFKQARELIGHVGSFTSLALQIDLSGLSQEARKAVRNFEPFVQGRNVVEDLYNYWELGQGQAPSRVLLARAENGTISGILILKESCSSGSAVVRVDHLATARFSNVEDTVRSLVNRAIDIVHPKELHLVGKRERIADLADLLKYGTVSQESPNFSRLTVSIPEIYSRILKQISDKPEKELIGKEISGISEKELVATLPDPEVASDTSAESDDESDEESFDLCLNSAWSSCSDAATVSTLYSPRSYAFSPFSQASDAQSFSGSPTPHSPLSPLSRVVGAPHSQGANSSGFSSSFLPIQGGKH